MTEEGALEGERKKFEAQRAQHAATAFGSATAFATGGTFGGAAGTFVGGAGAGGLSAGPPTWAPATNGAQVGFCGARAGRC